MKRSRKILVVLSAVAVAIAVVSLAFTGYVMGPSMIERRPFDAPEPSYDSWAEILANPQPITLRTLSTAMMETHLAGIMNLEHERAAGYEDGALQFPVVVGILEHEEHGAYLVDAGMDASCVDNPYGVVRGILVKKKLGRATQEPGTDIASVLQREGIALQGVFLTHLHPDHVAGIVDLPRDIPYVVGPGETYINFSLFMRGDHLEGIEALHELDFDTGAALPPFGNGIDVFGDGSMWALLTPGHSPGHVVYLVNGLEGQFLMVGDACMTKDLWELGVGPGTYSSDVEKAQETLELLQGFVDQYPQIEPVFGHSL